MRPKGKVVYSTPEQPEVLAAEKQQKQDREDRRIAAIERRENRVLLNKHTYAWLYEQYQARVAAGGTTKLPRCKRCEAVIHWEEPAHVCPGFTPKYVEHDDEWHERMEARRQAIREARLEDMRESRNSHYCDDCGEELHDEEHAIAHAEDCCRTVECPDCGEELEFMVEHECSVRE
jgi:hypothetical protein